MIAPMRIGFLTSELGYDNGWAHYSLSLLRAMRRAGVELTIITARNSPPHADLEAHAVLPTVSPLERFTLPRLLMNYDRVARLLRGCHVLHATVELYAPLAWQAARGRPFVITGHGSYVRLPQSRRWPMRGFYLRAFEDAARVVCVSRYTEQVAQEVAPGVQTTVINNGVDAERFAHLPTLASTIPARGAVILSVGGVKARKGTLELVEALAVVRQTVPDAQCVILGSANAADEYVQRVQAAVDRLGLRDCVHIMGFVDERTLLGWYGAARIFALPSMNVGGKFEGFGLSHLQASAAGLPAIGTHDCGAADAIDDGVTGLLVSQDNIAAELPQAILALLRDPERAQRMGAAGRAKAQSQSWDHVAAQMIGIYQDVMV